jgi:hypothetical protein
MRDDDERQLVTADWTILYRPGTTIPPRSISPGQRLYVLTETMLLANCPLLYRGHGAPGSGLGHSGATRPICPSAIALLGRSDKCAAPHRAHAQWLFRAGSAVAADSVSMASRGELLLLQALSLRQRHRGAKYTQPGVRWMQYPQGKEARVVRWEPPALPAVRHSPPDGRRSLRGKPRFSLRNKKEVKMAGVAVGYIRRTTTAGRTL